MVVNPLPAIVALAAAAAFCIDVAEAQTLTTLYRFQGGADGSIPSAALVYSGGTLYGTTFQGGIGCTRGCGSVFAVDAVTGAETILHDFNWSTHAKRDGSGPSGGMIELAGILYGTTLTGGTYGGEPVGGLISRRGDLYGTTFGGGACNSTFCGTVLEFDPVTRAETVLHRFQGPPQDGRFPGDVTLVYRDGFFYGTTREGGASDNGTVFKLDATSGAETAVRSFAGYPHDGAIPNAGVIFYQGHLYGTTSSGGAFGKGTLFRVDPITGDERIVHDFEGHGRPWGPAATLIEQGGLLYATTVNGGAHLQGTVISIDPATGEVTVLHSFDGVDGANPGGLIYNQGTFYGTTSGGGDEKACNGGCGTVFKLVP